METGVELIAKERSEQINKHGFSLERDKEYRAEELRWVAQYIYIKHWPSGWSEKWREKFRYKKYTEQLAIAGALLAAEIDRVNSSGSEV